jgi:hypothetical protein
MTIQYSTPVRNAQLDQVEVVAGASPKLQLRTGAQPANCAAAATGTLLCEIALPADYFSAAAAGAKAKLGTWAGVGVAVGNVGHYRIVDNPGTTCHTQGSVTATGGGGDATMDNINVAIDQAVTVNSFTINAGNA